MAQAAAAGDAAAALPAETLRCAGPAVCAGVREGVLWLLDARGQPFVLPTSHAGLRARSLALADAPALARSVAEQGAYHALHRICHTFAVLHSVDYMSPMMALSLTDAAGSK